jgi:hypothetical protein
MQRIMTKNDRSFSDRLYMSQAHLGTAPGAAVIELAAEVKPAALLLADPQLTPDVLLDLLPRLRSPQPEQILIYGRLLELHHADLTPVQDLLAELGYQPGLGLDPNIARGFVLSDG